LVSVYFSIDISDLAKQVKAPTLVLHGVHDAVVPFAEGRLMAALIPGSRFVPLESQNHILLEDEPAWGRFLAEVRAFLGVAGEPAEHTPEHQPAFPELTMREQEVLELIAQGLDNTEIASRLVVSQKTVRNHTTHIFQKLAVKNRAQAIVPAHQAGMRHVSR
jgi:DNA-binding NarL/FixJ family response regulator